MLRTERMAASRMLNSTAEGPHWADNANEAFLTAVKIGNWKPGTGELPRNRAMERVAREFAREEQHDADHWRFIPYNQLS